VLNQLLRRMEGQKIQRQTCVINKGTLFLSRFINWNKS